MTGRGPPAAGGDWTLTTVRGRAADLHTAAAELIRRGPGGASVPASVRVIDVTARAVVLGSRQAFDLIDRPALVAAGLDLARRRSGGGAVLVGAGECCWVDVVLPAGGPGWVDDVRAAAVWLGRHWAAALADAGVAGAVVWDGPLVRTRWSDLVCFAGVGPGEVLVGTAKVVGIAQRRTRAGALFQCAVPLAWRPADLLDVLVLPDDERAAAIQALASVAAPVDPAVAAALAPSLLKRLRAPIEPELS